MAPVAIDSPAAPPKAPPKVVGPATKKATRPSTQIPQSMIDEARKVTKESFDPSKHLDYNYKYPKRIYTMEEIGLENQGISPNAASEPFPLFTENAIRQIRAEVFSEESLRDCQYTSTFAKNMIRGMGPARAPFTYTAWSHPEVVARLSEVAGVDLVPHMDTDIAHVNVSFDDGSTTAIQNQNGADDDGTSAFAWHYDSFPFVCVMMLSDCTGMVGGETALRKPNGDVIKIRGPRMGTAMMLQGRYIEHQALKALGGRERISMAACFRPRSPTMKDETVLASVRGISDLELLYTQYTGYRLELLEERIRIMLKEERRRQVAKRPFNLPEIRNFLTEQKEFLESMLEELLEVEN